MQNFILILLVLGLAFFLYLIQIGEIDSNTFSVRKLQASVKFEIVTLESISLQKSETLRLTVKGYPYDIYSFTGMKFKHIPKSEYYMKIYNIPLDAKDAVTGTWLGSRYNFYVIEESIAGSQENILYRVYKTEYPTDSVEPVVYTHFKSVQGVDLKNAVEVRY